MRTDWTETGMMIFICAMMVIGGLTEGYPGLAVFGGLMLFLFALGYLLSAIAHVLPRLPEVVLLVLGLPLLAVALFMILSGNMQTWAILMVVGYVGLIVSRFLPDSAKIGTFQFSTGGSNLPKDFDPASLPPDTKATVIQKEFTIRPEEFGSIEEMIAKLVLAPHGVDLKSSTLELDPTAQRARELLATGDSAGALSLLEQGEGKSRDDSRVMAKALLHLGRYAEAVQALEWVPRDQFDSSTYFLLGEAQTGLGKAAEAAESYEQAAAHAISEGALGSLADPTVLPATLMRLNRLDAAAEILAGAPDSPDVAMARLELALRRKDPGEAYRTAQSAIAAGPPRVKVLLRSPGIPEILSQPDFSSIRELLTKAAA